MINHPIMPICCALSLAALTFASTVVAAEVNQVAVVAKQQKRSLQAQRNIPDTYIVMLKPSIIENQQLLNQVETTLQNSEILSIKRLSKPLSGFVVNARAEHLALVENLPEVDFVEPNQWVYFDEYQDTNPTQQSNLWGLDRVDQKILPLNEVYQYDYHGDGVDIYVIDTGVNLNHQEFGNRGRHGWDFVDNDNDATDCNGHGTHVAGIAAGATYGVAKGANVVALRVGTCDRQGQLDWVIDAINWVVQAHEAKKAEQPVGYNPSVINMSITAGASAALDSVVRNAINSGITFVTSAGNNRGDSCDYSPGRVSDVINVAASTAWDTRWGFSNYKSCVDLFAPGSNIKSAWFDSDTASSHQSGTSMAAPHVAGAAALYLEENPNLSVAEVELLLKQRAGKDKLRINSGTPNRLLYTLAGDSSTPLPRPVIDIDKGQTLTVSDARDGQRFYRLTVENGAKDLTITTSSGSGNVDLWVNFNSKPTQQSYLCRSSRTGNDESCELIPEAGEYYIQLDAVSDYQNVQLKADYTLSNDDGIARLTNGQPLDITDFKRFEERLYKIEVPAGAEALNVKTYGPNGDFDLYVNPGSLPQSNHWACRRTSSRSNETCVFNTPEEGTYYIKVRAYNVYNIANIFLKAEY